jgi:hypothetical protein
MIKVGNTIYDNARSIDLENISVDQLRVYALDTVNWAAGLEVQKACGGVAMNISAANSKAIALLAKISAATNPDLSGLTETEKASYDALVALADAGYSDSELLLGALTAVQSSVTEAAEKSARIVTATTVDEIIEILGS